MVPQERGLAREIALRAFVFWDGRQPAKRHRLVRSGQGGGLRDAGGAELSLARLEPLAIGGIYPANNEDRILVRLNEVPKHFVESLIAVEDRSFFYHAGFDLRGLARAARSVFTDRVQGGSTITQQLVKNFFLTPERTVRRKVTELLMAVLLELHYDKNEILETYLNEIYFGQDRDRAIHGVGLAGSSIRQGSPAPHSGGVRAPRRDDPRPGALRPASPSATRARAAQLRAARGARPARSRRRITPLRAPRRSA